MREAVSEVLSNPGEEPGDWPMGWWDDFDVLKAEYVAMGEFTGEAARLAYEHLKARARGMGLATGDAPASRPGRTRPFAMWTSTATFGTTSSPE